MRITIQRLAPVGANADDEDAGGDDARKAEIMRSLMSEAEQQEAMMMLSCGGGGNAGEATELRQRLMEMEEEQEELNSSLMSMTSHFAKVRLSLSVFCLHGGRLINYECLGCSSIYLNFFREKN